MAPQPPTQAGKFKPRKPAKKSKPAAVIAAPGTTAAVAPTSSESNPQRPSEVRSSGDVATSSQRRGGGGGGKAQHQQHQKPPRRPFNQPLPQGSVFFTGNAATTAATKKGRNVNRGASGIRAKQDGADGGGEEEEVVVGLLDVSIGSSAASLAKQQQKRAKQAADESAGDYYADHDTAKPSRRSGGIRPNAANLDHIMYDSDSDNDVESWPANSLQPTQLPYPSLSNTTPATDHLGHHSIENQPPPFSFTASPSEYSDCFLFQLPTRLPPLQTPDDGKEADTNNDKTTSESKNNDETVLAAVTPDVPEVITAPMVAGSFDNALTTAKAGRLGRIQVYKSGKAVLVMDGPEGKIRMNLTEGLSCHFYQQAVVINTDHDGSYTPVGAIKKTIVVTPDV